MPDAIAKLALEDGAVYVGRHFGAPGTTTGEVVFNTAMTGYQEVFSDPSYCGQIVTMTFPQIGNYGTNADDAESARPFLAGFVVKELPRRPSNYRSTAAFGELLAGHGVIGISGVDTRSLTRRLRIHGALRGILTTEVSDEIELVRRARSAPSMEGANLVDCVSPTDPAEWRSPLVTLEPRRAPTQGGAHVVAIDCGIKHNILRYLAEYGCRVTVAPAGVSAERIRAWKPDGLLVGNGPGDPAAVGPTIATLRALLGEFPTFGICLGHQMLALALGAETYKLRFGHHGANQPVRNEATGRVEITSQNHGFAVELASLEAAGGQATHINLNDGSLEGFVHADHQVVAVQFHPEASPGPRDASYLFRRFAETVRERKRLGPEMLFAEQPR